MDYVKGLDVSNWQSPEKIDYDAIAQDGYAFAAMRCTVGDYYPDASFAQHWDNFGAVGMMRTPYLVVAPATTAGRQINAQQHLDLFYSHFGDRQAELPWTLDCELTRLQSVSYITNLILELVTEFEKVLGRYPIIYTRQTWWDLNVQAKPEWERCPLWAARYTDPGIPGPWGDGKYTFRDWDTWHFWQWTSHGRIPNYAGDIDLDCWNGDLQSLQDFSMGINDQVKLNILWREAGLHGWNLNP